MEAKPLRALCAVADGSEDIELTTTTDILVRAGVQVILASVMPSKQVTFARGLKVVADVLIAEAKAEDYDLVSNFDFWILWSFWSHAVLK